MKVKKITVKIIAYGKELTVLTDSGTRLRTLLDRERIDYSLPCGGEGKCGRCKVRFLEGAPIPDVWEETHLTEKEISLGYRILCRCVLYDDACLELGKENLDGGMTVETLGGNEEKEITVCGRDSGKGSLGIAIDLGTTTIAGALISLTVTGYEVVRSGSRVNRQRKFGSDVISRISAAENKETAEELRRLAVSDIEELVKELSEGADIKAVTVTGNTTMLHLLSGYDVSGLGKYPYTPYSIGMEKMDSDLIFKDMKDIRLGIMPGISAFVGADIVAGLYTMPLDLEEKFFFLDLGTNGEMAFYDGEKLKVTSTAAGPVFEAGGISCGMASVPGAISHVELDDRGKIVKLETIAGEKPAGICGTGVMEITSELVRCGIIDETGLLSEEYFDEGYPLTEDGSIRFTQQDIRNVQLAKAAIFTGAKALLEGQIPDMVYISGGFGTNIDPEKIANLRMFPPGFDDKIACVGNTALKGAARYTAAVLSGWENETDAEERLRRIAEGALVLELAETDSFDAEYLEAMNF